MQRYTVKTSLATLPLAIPFEDGRLVSAFVQEVQKRVTKVNASITASTHGVSLHVESETGALLDEEDILSNLISPKSETIFAVFKVKQAPSAAPTGSTAEQITSQLADSTLANAEDQYLVRFVTPASAKYKDSLQPIAVAKSATVKKLHEIAAAHLNLPSVFDKEVVDSECNCSFAKQLADGESSPDHVLVVSSKSVVDRLALTTPSDAAVHEALSTKFSATELNSKKVIKHGGVLSIFDSKYTKTPVVAICSKHRHIPAHARTHEPDDSGFRFRLIDLHTSELPISSGSMDATLGEAHLDHILNDGVLDIYVVSRASTGTNITATGRNAIFRARPHWVPNVQQTERGIAMFLSALRVFCDLVPWKDADCRMKDAVLHVFDLLTKFPPALRALLVLIDDKTPTTAESSALAHAVYESIHDIIMPTGIIGTDKARVFEGARLFFGFVLEKARSVKLPDTVKDGDLPYLSAFDTIEIKDFKTSEAIKEMVMTTSGMLEKGLYTAFDKEKNGVLHDSHLQPTLVPLEPLPLACRTALLSAGTAAELLIFDQKRLTSAYQYADRGELGGAVDVSELADFNHLAELAARNKLAVHRPSQLASPMHGEETMNPPVVEQLIAPIIKQYESEGTAVFDSFGGATVRRLQAPDELLMFCVDNSASMRQATDFAEVNDSEPTFTSDEMTAESVVEGDFYNRSTFDEMKEYLNKYEGISDMLAIVAEAPFYVRLHYSHQVLELLRTMLGNEIVAKHKEREERSQYIRGWYARQHNAELDTKLKALKAQWAGLKTHEEALAQFLIFRATTTPAAATDWKWSPGDELPPNSPPNMIPTLPEALTEVPDRLVSPVSRDLMSDAVKASDGFTYSRQAIEQWFSIRKSSPMTGLSLSDTHLAPDDEVSQAAADWVLGSDDNSCQASPPAKKTRLSVPNQTELKVTFLSKNGPFTRTIKADSSVNELYKVAFRGLKARFTVFQLALDESSPLRPSAETVSTYGIQDGQQIIIRLAEEVAGADSARSSSTNNATTNDNVLIKVYKYSSFCFSFWVKRSATTGTLASIAWKFYRHSFHEFGIAGFDDVSVWTDLYSSGDGLLNGNPREVTQNLHPLLNAAHCRGKLEEEPVHSEQSFLPSSSRSTQPLVLKVEVEKRRTVTGHEVPKMSRLDVLKQLFEALINRSIAYGYKTHVGLITFASNVEVQVPMTHVVEQFRSQSNAMRAQGDTALWDALAMAKDQLDEYAKKYPTARRRIIVISDGEDTKSVTNAPKDLAWSFMQDKTVVDSIALGSETARDLRGLSYLLGGYAFHPTSLANALAIWTKFNENQFPARKEHPNMNNSFILLSAASARSISHSAPGNAGVSRGLRINRLMNELRSIVAHVSDRKYDVYVSEQDMTFMKVVMEGPEDSPYSGGTFLLYLHVGEQYPTFAPDVRFISRISHPNISLHGKVCHALLSRDWTSDTSLLTVLDTIYGLLLQAETSDPVNTTDALGYLHDQVEWAESVREHVRKHASKTREQWKQELLEVL
ncbi:putative bifunctional E2/E3 enzyme [Pseudocercospora fuligena]|uniref:peptidylprolyl isomerase n=1 Tax=Pseudocercospora fuligena TaxID=685502 RepID=A0A8H6RQA3_9PEZI|nr:putative bifunctional E2/E3 enzyme [Pseudocercospora fuligena]